MALPHSCGSAMWRRAMPCERVVKAETIKALAGECGFELAGVARADSVPDIERFDRWLADGMAGEMRYLTDHRAEVRRDVRKLLPSARSVICVGKLYNAGPSSNGIARYARSRDYHVTMRDSLKTLAARLLEIESFEYKICVDTAPLLERSFARQAGLGWIGKNTCLINEPRGSWFLLGEIVTSLELDSGLPPPDRCGTCRRCIDACPTQALVPDGNGWTLDSRRCISYLTIELRAEIPEEFHSAISGNVFGCDICQEVCPWNSDAPVTSDPAFAPVDADWSSLTEETFRETFGKTPVSRAKYAGFMRNAEIVKRNR
jgi:epoxyqueuosine reductase